MQAITITLNGVEVSGHSGMTILDLARESGVHIPTLCHSSHLNPYGACRICLVEDERNGALLASCVAPIASGMVINTQSEKVLESRRTIVKLMLASHPDTCMVCDKGNRCELRQIATDLGIGLIDLQRIPHQAVIQEINPFIERDLSKCIMCAKCIRADQELVVIGAIDYFNRGFTSKPATLGDLPLEKSECTFCGTCVALCPTGAIAEKIRPYSGTANKVVSTICSFCGCGCNINLEVSDNRIVRARPNEKNSPNGVTLCARGSYGYDYIHSPDRLTQPLLKVDGEFQPVSWEEVLILAASRLSELKDRYGADSLAVFGSSKCTNEENYLLQKFAREVLDTNNIDNGGNLYNAEARKILTGGNGLPASTDSIEKIESSDLILLVGADPSTSAPILDYAIKRAVRYKTARLIEKPCGLSVEDMKEIKQAIDESDRVSIIYGTDFAQSSEKESEVIKALVNLAVLKSENGNRLYILQRENNAQGASDMGCLSDFLPGYQRVQSNSGLTVFQMMAQAKAGKIKGMYIVGENPVANFPDKSLVEEALSKIDFLLVQELFLTETAQMADLVLPAAGFAEKDGTFTNFEGRVQRIHQAVDPPGEALPDWKIIQSLANKTGHSMNYDSPEEIMRQIASEITMYQEITYGRLESGGIAWAGRDIGLLNTHKSISLPQELPTVLPEEQIPKRSLYRFGSGSRSSRSERLSAMMRSQP